MITIERMNTSHLDEVVVIEQDTFTTPWTMEGYRQALLQQENIFVIAKDDAHVVGYCGVYATGYEGEITNVAVKRSRRNQHIGNQMLKSLLEEGQKQGITSWYLEVRASNVGAIYVYQKLGFRIIGTRKGFYKKPDEDGLIMNMKV